MLLLLSGCGASEAAAPEPYMLEAATPPPVAALMIADGREHPALMANPRGAFAPKRAVTKRELCLTLEPLLEGLPEGAPVFTDFVAGDDGYDAAARLFAAGLLPEAEGGAFGPAEDVTRAELTHVLRCLTEGLSGEQRSRIRALTAEVAAGKTARSGTSAGEGESIRREELAVVIERLAGREPDAAGLLLAGCLPRGIGTDHYAWAYIADAVTDGVVPAAEPGVHRANGWLYAVWDDGTLVTDVDYGVWAFGPDGRYTTGDAALDGYIADVLDAIGAAALSDEEALQAAYLYVKRNGEYLVQPEDMEVLDPGVMGWEYERALRFFENGGGTCYGYAAAFGLLARALGREAYIVSAEVNQYNGAHAFVVIPEDGVDWIYDVELEATRPERHAELGLYRIQNHVIYHYWYESVWSEA